MYIKQILNDVGIYFSIREALQDSRVTPRLFIVSWVIYL